uniref:PIR Superfamily Protein n=1 Tax=Ascaris lumbricoides TaxID=6252 RepID=A0A0M3I9P6_ASCLU
MLYNVQDFYKGYQFMLYELKRFISSRNSSQQLKEGTVSDNMGMIADTLNSIHWHIKQINEFDVYSGNSTHSLHNNYVYR